MSSENIKTPYDSVINNLFKSRWSANLSGAAIEKQRKQLYKTLFDQVRGYWSGHTAYHLAIDGGFLVDDKSNALKKLTAVGEDFMFKMNENWKIDAKTQGKPL